MQITRRNFLKISAGSLGLGLTGGLGFNLSQAHARIQEMKISKAKVTKSICPYCSVSCGVLIYSYGDGAMNVQSERVIHVEGNPDDPINRGTLCPKGITLKDLINSPYRLKKPLYKPAGAKDWQEIEWDEAIEKFARLVKDTRDRTFIHKDRLGRVVNRCDSIIWGVGSTLGNEEGYLMVKLGIALGLTARETQATI